MKPTEQLIWILIGLLVLVLVVCVVFWPVED